MKKNLVIVESPAKAKTISQYLGKDFKVLSSVGHIRNIAKKSKQTKNPIDPKNNYQTIFEIDKTKTKLIKELKAAIKQAEIVWLATDEDREGEAIAWHLCEVLKLDLKTTKRIVFHEITKEAIEQAIKNPRLIDMNLVQAQQARQILDWLVGFELSPVVWQKVPGGKSAGRVQSPAVRLLVEKEKEIEAFNTSASFKISAQLEKDGEVIKADLVKKISTQSEAEKILKDIIDSDFIVKDITKSPLTRNPSPPFTTSTLQQEANKKLGFSAKATMTNAQKLYQTGKITYMRTDSVNLSSQAINNISSYIEKTFGKDYIKTRQYKNKAANAQEAHEAIRPTDINQEIASSDEYEQKLYNLIRQRTIASQMAPAKLEKTVIKFCPNKLDYNFEAKGEIVVFAGFLKAYQLDRVDKLLAETKVEAIWQIRRAEAQQVYNKAPARYSEGSLVKKLEELGIGRPSTYASIINTIQLRNYAQRGESDGKDRQVIVLSVDRQNPEIKQEIVIEKTGSDKGKLIPTSIGEVLTSFLTDYFKIVVDYDFTAKAEKGLDQIASSQAERNQIIDEIYLPFHKLIEKSDDIERSKVSQSREVGKHPKTGQVILARFGRFGPMLQLGEKTEEQKPQFAPMPKGYKIDNITLEIALEAFELPRLVGQTEEGEIIKANIGRFGPYIQIGDKFISIKGQDPRTITQVEALELYQNKLKADAEKQIADFGDIKILKGRFGPYITDGNKNAKIPKELDPKTVDVTQAKQILADSKPKSRHRTKAKKAKK